MVKGAAVASDGRTGGRQAGTVAAVHESVAHAVDAVERQFEIILDDIVRRKIGGVERGGINTGYSGWACR